MKAYDKPNIEIHGTAIGDLNFCSSFMSSITFMEVRVLLSQLEQVGMMDPQVAMIPLYLCGGFCKLVHLARSTPPSLSSKALNDDIHRAFRQCSAVNTSNNAWEQAQLSLGLSPLICSFHLLHLFIWLWIRLPPVSSNRGL